MSNNKRKLIYFLTEYNSEKLSIIYYNKFNKLIEKKDNKYYIDDFIYGKQEITIEAKIIKFDEMLLLDLKNLMEEALKMVPKLTEENFGEELNSGCLLSILHSKCIKFDYNESSKLDVFDFFTDIFSTILNKHCLSNGNKRLALFYLRALMGYFGYYLKWSSNQGFMKKEFYINNYEVLLREFASKLERKEDNKTKEILKEIKEWIYENTFLNYKKY